jgi:cell division protein FtsB
LDAEAKRLTAQAASLATQAEQQTQAAATLVADRAALDARIKAFQDKVAALNA